MFRLKFIFLAIFLLLVLSFRFFTYFSSQKHFLDGEQAHFVTTIRQEPKIVGANMIISARPQNYDTVSLFVPRTKQLRYGDTIDVSGKVTVKKVQRVSTQNSTSTLNEKVYYSIYSPIITHEKTSENPILSVAYSMRQQIIDFFQKSLPSVPASLLLGIVFGIKQQMPQDFTDALRQTGVFHVIAASGMNVTIIGGFLASICAYFLPRKLALIVSISGIIFYAILSGLEPSIIRASCMGIIVFSAQIMGRQTLAWYGLLLTGYIMLLFDPGLITDVGFQLSFSATLGLLYIRPLLEGGEKVKAFLEKSVIGEEVITTIAAQLATLGILLYYFGTYSLWSVVVNGLVLWVVPLLMMLGGVGAMVSFVFPQLAKLLLFAALPFLFYFQTVVTFFANLGGVWQVHEVLWQFVIGYYFILTSIVLYLHKKKAKLSTKDK